MKINNILLYEPNNTADFYPFSILHSIWEIRVGAFRIFEKYQFLFPDANVMYYGRKDHLASFYKRFGFESQNFHEGNLLALDCSLLPSQEFLTNMSKIIETLDKSLIFTINKKAIGIYIASDDLNKTEEFSRPELISDLDIDLFAKFSRIELSNFTKLNYLYDAIYANGAALREDAHLRRMHNKLLAVNDYTGVYSTNADEILLGKNVQIAPGCVLDASEGPIILDDNVKIMANAVILGPCYIGKNSIIKIGAKIYQDCSFGEWCKVGGEIENSIIQSYSNKQHEGFLGHSFLCEWVNLGADTNNSDLKNTYSNIKIRLENEEIDTGKMFLGLLCGDHTKTGINTMFTTGTVVGICGILVREWFLPNFIPSFSWGGGKNSPTYKVTSAIETAKIVLGRRNKELLPEEEKLIRNEYNKIISKRQ